MASLTIPQRSSKTSTLNSSTTPLSSGATFTGTFEETLDYAMLSISVIASHASAVNGLVIEWSTDGSNVDDSDSFSILANTGKQYTFGTITQYYRVKYTNGATLQTSFRLETVLHPEDFKASSHRINSSIADDDDAELTKAVITGKSPSGIYLNVATDEEGRILSSGLSEVINPLPSIDIVDRRVLATGAVYALTSNISQDTAIKECTFGGRGPGEGIFGKYVAATQAFLPFGDFESSGDVSNWVSSGMGDGLALVPTFSTAQFNTGAGSLKLGPATRSDQNHYPEVTYTWSSPQTLDAWRYIQAYFRNDPPAGGAVTRTISIRLTDNTANVRIYSVSGLTNAAPFNAAGWIQILGEIRIPTSQVGTTFDINNVVSVSLRMQDSGNKAYTAIYWDTAKTIGALDIRQKIYTNGNTIQIKFDPVEVFDAGEVMYLALRNNDTVSREYQITVSGVNIT